MDGALYKTMEFVGEGVQSLTMEDRLCICNMAIEAGAKNGIFPVDEDRGLHEGPQPEPEVTEYEADPDAEYEQTIEIDLDALEPTVSYPHLPENTHRQRGKGHQDRPGGHRLLHQRPLEDMEAAYNILKGKHRCQGRARHHHPRHHGRLQGVHPARLDRSLH